MNFEPFDTLVDQKDKVAIASQLIVYELSNCQYFRQQ